MAAARECRAAQPVAHLTSHVSMGSVAGDGARGDRVGGDEGVEGGDWGSQVSVGAGLMDVVQKRGEVGWRSSWDVGCEVVGLRAIFLWFLGWNKVGTYCC